MCQIQFLRIDTSPVAMSRECGEKIQIQHFCEKSERNYGSLIGTHVCPPVNLVICTPLRAKDVFPTFVTVRT